MNRSFPIFGIVFFVLLGTTVPAQAQSDWDLYMLRLVNRARMDPAGEDERIGSTVTDSRAAVQPLAYNLLIAQAAQNHTRWMLTNLGNPNIPNGGPDTIDSFSHQETPGTPDFTGVSVADPNNPDRLGYVGFDWSTAGENITTSFTSADTAFTFDAQQIEDLHKGWWESTGHRANMLNAGFAAFGFDAQEGPVTVGQSNDSGLTQILTVPAGRILFGTQNFGTPYFDMPDTYISGLLFDDLDLSGDWTPRESGASLREGLGDVPFDVYDAGTMNLVTTGMTMDNGAFAINIDDGHYDIKFTGPFRDGALPQVLIQDVIVDDINTLLDDIDISIIPLPIILGDMDGSGALDAFDVDDFELALADPSGYDASHAGLDRVTLGDIDGSGGLDAFDVPGFEAALASVGGSVPEPTSMMLLVCGAAALARRRRCLR